MTMKPSVAGATCCHCCKILHWTTCATTLWLGKGVTLFVIHY